MSGVSNANSYEQKHLRYKNVRMPLSGAQRRSNREVWRPGEAEPRKANLCVRKRNLNYRSSAVLFGKLNNAT